MNGHFPWRIAQRDSLLVKNRPELFRAEYAQGLAR
jgi:hypothetical protein